MVPCESKTDFGILVEGAQTGDRASLDRLVSLVEPKLRAHFLRMTLDVDLAADFTQETLLRMLRGLGRLQNAESFWPWLFRIAGNLLNDHYRRNGRNVTTRFSAIEPQNLDDCLRDESLRPETGVFRCEMRAMVRNAISTLKEKPRRVLAMRCYENMSYEQIGTHVGCSDLAARTTFSRAKKSIEHYLKSHGIKGV
ncbi:MAG: sigma-70 family RNA polymerase sigma factor [Phycisphaerae bacterium]|nr:sigma-70 family RNA polymerase sigma factor [Phycisphaerae bacterium]